MKKPRTLSYDTAIDLMRRPGARLIQTTGKGAGYYVTRGGAVSDTVADRIKDHPLVRSRPDALFPGMSETWRMIDDREGEQ